MKKATIIVPLAVVAVLLVGVFASSSYAFPSSGAPCVKSGCHVTPPVGDPSVVPTPTPEPTTTPEPTSTVSLDETMPPVTTSDAIASYVGTATVHLTATDGAGRGVAYVYYSIDGKRVHLVTGSHGTVTIAAPLTGTATHTLVFWAQDQAGNVEAPKTVTLTIEGPSAPVVRHRATCTTPIAPWSVRKASMFTVYGYLMPQHDAGTEAITLQFYRLQAGQWVLRRTTKVAVTNHSDDSKYSARVSLPYAGVWKIRAVHPGDALHVTSFSGYRSLISHY